LKGPVVTSRYGRLHLSSTQEQTVTGRPVNQEDPEGGELLLWAHDALQRMFTGPEGDIHQMALSMEVEVSSGDFREEIGLPKPDHMKDEGWLYEPHFLSERDRQYIKTLVVLGYREDAAILVDKAYGKRSNEISTGGSERLFSNFDLEYLEMLILVGQRRRAVEVFLGLMNDYELSILGRIAKNLDNQSKLDEEYREILSSIETTGALPPEKIRRAGKPVRQGLIHRALRVISGLMP